MAQLADPYITKRALSVKRLIEYGLLRDPLGRRLVPLEPAEAERRLKQRLFEEEENGLLSVRA